MDASQWPQGIGVENSRPQSIEKKPRPQKEQAVNCPRCSSTNTKFCYYNNYSLTQPRYFCKTCRRYWTEGGSLRNVPVGGGSRKNKRPSSSSSVSSPNTSNINIISSSSKKMVNLISPPNFSPQNPKIHEGHDLNLAYNPSHYNGISGFVNLPYGLDSKNLNPNQNPNSNLPVMEFLKTGNLGFSNSVLYNSSDFALNINDQFKPSLSFSLDGLESIHDQDHSANNPSRSMIFPFEELKSTTNDDDQFHEQDNRGDQGNGSYWNGMLAGGSW